MGPPGGMFMYLHDNFIHWYKLGSPFASQQRTGAVFKTAYYTSSMYWFVVCSMPQAVSENIQGHQPGAKFRSATRVYVYRLKAKLLSFENMLRLLFLRWFSLMSHCNVEVIPSLLVREQVIPGTQAPNLLYMSSQAWGHFYNFSTCHNCKLTKRSIITFNTGCFHSIASLMSVVKS